MTWHTGPMLAFDTETTGTDPTQARIVSAALVDIVPGQPSETTSWLVDPGVEIPAEASAIHGITTEQARADGINAALAAETIADRIVTAWRAGTPVVAMNACYDLTVLDRELARHNLASLADRLLGAPMLVIDPLVIDRALDQFRKGKKRLTELCQVYKVDLDEAHTADADALAAARVAYRMAIKYPGALWKTAEELATDQARWHANWAVDFEAYLRRTKGDPAIVIGRDWPLTPAEVTA